MSCQTEGKVVKQKGKLSNRRQVVERKCGMEGMMGCGRGVWCAQPLINNAQKMPSTEGVLDALACTLILEGGKIGRNVFKGSKE